MSKIYVLDELTAKPGQGEALLAAYMERYAPGARERGMTHEFTWVSPPVWLKDDSNTLMIVWSVSNVAAWWAMSHGGKRNPVVQAWWRDAEAMIESRERRMLSNAADVAALTNV